MYLKFLLLCCIAILINTSLLAQTQTNAEFGKISAKDFTLDGISADTSYGAIVIADVGKSSFQGNQKGYFSLVYKHYRRVKILRQKGFDIATVSIPLYKSSSSESEEELTSLKACTYNLEGGKVIETKLDKDAVFKEKQDKNHTVRKFTLPSVKEGSIIEYSYTINSDFLFNLQPWNFQGNYPRLWSEYELNCPEFFEYVVLTKGTHPTHIKDAKQKFQNFNIRLRDQLAYDNSTVISLSSNNIITRWVMKDVPVLKEENFTSTMKNHLSALEFQMSGQRFPNMPFKDIMGSWVKASMELLKDESFGAEFNNKNGWVANYVEALKLDGKSPYEKAFSIYKWIQKDFSCKGTNGAIYLSAPLKDVAKAKTGYVSDINLLLTLMLSKAGLTADPVILSTRSNGRVNSTYPLIHQYNYVISKLTIDTVAYYLDASDRSLGFNKIPSFCYNGVGVRINLMPRGEELYPDHNTERKSTTVMLMNNAENKNHWIGNFSSVLGYAESTTIRDEIAEKGKEAYINKIVGSYTGGFSIEDIKLVDFTETEKPVTLNAGLHMDREGTETLLYFNPMLKEGLQQNYFKTSERFYPVELPFKMEESYSFNIQVPEGYVVDELPKSAKVILSDSDASFAYLVSKSGDFVTITSTIKINKTDFTTAEYDDLRNFFDYIVKKHAEQIVFKKS